MSEAGLGRRFSHAYLAGETLSQDSKRMRRRIGTCFKTFFPHEHEMDVWLGKILEAELGIEVLEYAYSHYVSWESFFSNAELRDVLDAITVTLGVAEKSIGSGGAQALHQSIERIISEERIGYWIDELGGLHPKVDVAFDAVRSDLIRSLSGAKYEAARAHLEQADKALLMDPIDGRAAIRCTFDVIENIFKQAFSGVTHVNNREIKDKLPPHFQKRHPSNQQDLRASLKIVDSFNSWVEAVHFFRHEAGKSEPTQPSNALAVMLVSHGFSFARWLAEVLDDVP